ncbi:MAG: sigma-70 family RNA polymerase sigma factor [Isosphaeraceae bacterium]
MADSQPRAELERGEPAACDPAAWVQEHADALFRYARERVASPHEAEDLVQETFLAALSALGRFQHRSAARTWLVAILRRKLMDHYRRGRRDANVESMETSPRSVRPFDGSGLWLNPPAAWRSPERALEDEEFREVLAGCVDQLPSHLAETFLLRECQELEADEVRRALDLSETNLRVRLHRARLLLRECLERRWFGATDPQANRSGDS